MRCGCISVSCSVCGTSRSCWPSAGLGAVKANGRSEKGALVWRYEPSIETEIWPFPLFQFVIGGNPVGGYDARAV
jgi:hypothetical protein